MSIRAYDFAKPPRASGSWFQRLTSWFRAAFQQAAKAWARELPFALEPDLRDIDVVRAADALHLLPDNSVGYKIAIAGSQLPTLLVLPRPLLLAIVQGLLGESCDKLPEDRDLTEVERSLVEYFLQTLW